MTKTGGSFNWKALTQKTWVIVLAGLIVPPVGMVLAWLKPEWTTRTRVIATGLMLLMLLGRMGSRIEKNAVEKNTSGGEEQASMSLTATEDEGNADFTAGFDAAIEASRLTPQERGLFLSQIEQDIKGKKDQKAFRRGMAKGFRELKEAVDASLEERRREQYQKGWETGVLAATSQIRGRTEITNQELFNLLKYQRNFKEAVEVTAKYDEKSAPICLGKYEGFMSVAAPFLP